MLGGSIRMLGLCGLLALLGGCQEAGRPVISGAAPSPVEPAEAPKPAALPRVPGRQRALIAMAKADVNNLKSALAMYYSDWGRHPPSGNANLVRCLSGLPKFASSGRRVAKATATAPIAIVSMKYRPNTGIVVMISS